MRFIERTACNTDSAQLQCVDYRLLFLQVVFCNRWAERATCDAFWNQDFF